MIREQARDYYTYRCKYCGAECFKKTPSGKLLPSGQVPTRLGDYGSNATPTSANYDEEMYEATTISFTAETAAAPAKINDSVNQFAIKRFRSDMTLVVVTTSGTNDGTYTIGERGVSPGVLELSTSDSLTTEAAAVAGTVTISRRIKQPNAGTGGCSFCLSLNSK